MRNLRKSQASGEKKGSSRNNKDWSVHAIMQRLYRQEPNEEIFIPSKEYLQPAEVVNIARSNGFHPAMTSRGFIYFTTHITSEVISWNKFFNALEEMGKVVAITKGTYHHLSITRVRKKPGASRFTKVFKPFLTYRLGRDRFEELFG